MEWSPRINKFAVYIIFPAAGIAFTVERWWKDINIFHHGQQPQKFRI